MNWIKRHRACKSCILAVILLAIGTLYAHKKSLSGRTQLPAETTAKLPVVIVYVVDTMRADHLSTYGYFRETTPYLTEFAKDSILFTQAYAQCSWTKPSVACMFTGKFPSSHGVVTRNDVFPREHVTIAEHLTKLGYYTAGFVSNYNLYKAFGFGQGFTTYHEFPYDLAQDKFYAPAEKILHQIDTFLPDSITQPLFLYVHTMDPHSPYLPEPPFNRKFKGTGPFITIDGVEWPINKTINAYDGELAYSDQYFRKFIELLKARNLYDKALIFFLSDHGEEFGDHGGEGHGYTLYEEQIRLPFILKLPNQRLGGKVETRPIRTIDIYPTICNLLGAVPDAIDGVSFLPLLEPNSNLNWAPILYAEQQHDGYNLRSVISDNFKLIEQTTPSLYTALFNLSEDTREEHDLTEIIPQRSGALKNQMNLITSGLNNTYQLDVFNSAKLEAVTELTGRLTNLTDTFSKASVLGLDKGDEFNLSLDNTAISFSFKLINTYHPTGIPDLIVAKRQVFFSVQNPAAQVELSLNLNGKPLPKNNLILGLHNKLTAPTPFPLLLSLDDSRILISPSDTRPFFEEQNTPTVRLYRILMPPPEQLSLDSEQQEILNVLGYMK